MREHKKSRLGIISWAMVLTAALALGSCSSDETLDSIEPKAITFGGVTMENSSRAADPSYGQTTNLLDKFQVWGTVSGNAGTAKIFNGAEVTRGNAEYGDAWTQTTGQAQYWIPSATYNFMAIANATNVAFGTDNAPSDLPTAINFELTDGSKDLLLGEIDADVTGIKTVTTDPTATPTPAGPVAFNMSHLLSKVHFTFQNADANTSITDINVTGHFASGTYTIGNATWSNQVLAATTSPLSFGNCDATTNPVTSQYARLIIPGTQTWNITFKLNGQTYNKPLELTNFTFAPNSEYNIVVTLGIDAELSVSVQDWNGVTIQNNFSDNVSVEVSGTKDGRIKWINKEELSFENNKVAIKQGYNSASFKFTIAGPLGGTWYAMLVTQQGNPNAFDISPTQGEVGTEYTITIRTNGANNTREANMAELRFIVRQGGKILSVDNLTTNADHSNYIIVQNPAIN